MQAVNTLGRYHIIRELARSNDIVYEAMDPGSGKKIALKELQVAPNLAGQARQDRIQRFTREARAAARLKHTNIVRILDHGQVQGRYYIAMEFLEGQSLRDVLRQRGAMPLQEALRIAASVADGLDYAHNNGVVHRDVKPDNVHLEPDGRVVITDFGIARLTFEPSLTADGQIFGTPSYMSPEQIAGKDIDKRSDIFSLGVMLYEMIAGRKPFTGDSVITITYNIMNVEASPIAGAPAGVDQVIRRAIAKEAGQRYASAAEFAEDLRLVLQGQPPRHAARPMPASSTPRASVPSAAPRTPARPPSGNGAARPSSPMGGMPGGRPPGPVPGVRPPSRPMSTYAPPAMLGRASGPVPPAVAASPIAAPVGAAAPMPTPVNAPAGAPKPTRSNGTDLGWLFGWLALAIVVGVMIVGLVWAVVVAREKVQQDSTARISAQSEDQATRLFNNGRYEEALQAYLQAAQGLTGTRGETVRKNAATAAEMAAEKRLKGKESAEAERLARQALDLNPNLASAYNVLGRALAAQGNVDDAVKQFTEAVSAASRERSTGASAVEIKDAQSAERDAPLWEAETLYNDGLRQNDKNPLLARQRFEDTIKAAPKSSYAQNAQVMLGRIGVTGSGGSVPPPGGGIGSIPGMGGGAGSIPDVGTPRLNSSPPPLSDPDGPIRPPKGWDPNYRNF